MGLEPNYHLLYLRDNRMLPLRTLFAVDHKSPYYNERSKKSVFYAQSWALLHYLIIGKTGHDRKLTTFLDLIASNEPVETAFPKAFETTFEAMEKELNSYVRQNQYNVLRGQFAAKLELDTTTGVKELTEAEAEAYLGDLLLHSNRPDAETHLLRALQLDPNLGMAHASLGMLRFRQGQTDEARASLERAVAASSQNYLAHYYYAYTLSRQRPDDTDVRYTPEQLARIREHAKRAIALRPDYPESYKLLAFVSLVSSTEVKESIEQMKRVLKETPGNTGYMFMLGQLYMHEHDYQTARPLLEAVAKSSDQMSGHAQYLVDRLNRIAKYGDPANMPSNIGGGGNRPGPEVVAGETVVRPSDPLSDLREALRKPAAGETQMLATLVKIECEVKNIVFVFQTPAGLLRLRTNSFEDMEITTFTADVRGDISCGPRKPENVVVICYLPNTDKRMKVDGVLKSIEFVPADFKLKPDK
jgi:tetratricopeptide (TPR) repeat protein